MPIDPSVLSSSKPEPEKQPSDSDAQEGAAAEQGRRKRRTKAEMIAAAVVPAMDDVVEIKDSGTGAKIERPWRDAVRMFRYKKATWLDKPQEYAFLKYEQQHASQDAAAAYSDTGEDPANPETDRSEADGLENDASGQFKAPDGAELGDEVVIGPDTYTVGHDRALVKGVVAKDGEIVHAKRRWKREIGDPNGPFVAERISRPSIEQRAGELEQGASNGKADDVTVETERLPRQMEQVSDGDDGVLKWKIGNGILEKIGLPDYSSLQVGPISASRMVIDDGRRVVVELNDGRSAEVPEAVIEAFEEIDNTVEYIASRFRGQLQAFLQATGALKQPVS